MNAKIYNGNVQPNHKEYKIWVNDEGIIKTWNGTEWIEQSGASSGGSGESSGSDDSVYFKYEGLITETEMWGIGSIYKTKDKETNTIRYSSGVNIGTNLKLYDIIAVKAHLNDEFTMNIGQNESLMLVSQIFELLKEAGIEITYITKEQFYSLE